MARSKHPEEGKGWLMIPQKPSEVFWGDVNQNEVNVRLPPGMSVDAHLEYVEGVSPVHSEGNLLPHPSEWEHLPRLLPDEFCTWDRDGDKQRLNKGDVVVQVATGLTEAFVHELMEWLAVDGQRAFNPHPVVDGKPDQHWAWIGERLGVFFADLLVEFPDSGWNNPLDKPADPS